MKKIFFITIAVGIMSFISCGNQTQNATPANENETGTTLETAKGIVAQLKEKIESGDSQEIGEVIQTAVNKLAELIAKGNTEAARQYQEQIKNFVEENAEKIKEATGGDEAVNKLIDSFVNVPVKAEEAIEDAAKDAKDAAVEKAEDLKEAATEKIEDAKDAANKAAKDLLKKMK